MVMPQQARDKSASPAGCRGWRQRRQTPDSRIVSLHTKLRGMHAPNGFNATSKSATKPTQCIPPRLRQSQTSSKSRIATVQTQTGLGPCEKKHGGLGLLRDTVCSRDLPQRPPKCRQKRGPALNQHVNDVPQPSACTRKYELRPSSMILNSPSP